MNIDIGKIIIVGQILNIGQFKVIVQGLFRSIYIRNDLRIMPLLNFF